MGMHVLDQKFLSLLNRRNEYFSLHSFRSPYLSDQKVEEFI